MSYIYSVTPLGLYNMVEENTHPYSVTYNGQEYIWSGSTYSGDAGMLLVNLSGDTMAFVNEPCITYTSPVLTEAEKELLRAPLSMIARTGSETIEKFRVYVPVDDAEGECVYSHCMRICINYKDPAYGAYSWYSPSFKEDELFESLMPGRKYAPGWLGL